MAGGSTERASSGFQGREGVFYFVAFVALPLGWLAILWANGSYDRRYLGLGSEEFKRVVRSSITVVAAVSLLAFGTRTQLSRVTVAWSVV